jgi:hypothetical protein
MKGGKGGVVNVLAVKSLTRQSNENTQIDRKMKIILLYPNPFDKNKELSSCSHSSSFCNLIRYPEYSVKSNILLRKYYFLFQ